MLPLSKLKAFLLIASAASIFHGCNGDSVGDKNNTVKKEPIKNEFDIGRVTIKEAEPVEKPKNFKLAVKMAKQCIDDAEYKTAIELANYAIEYRPKSYLGYYLRGRARYDLGLDEVDGAIADLLKSDRLKPLDSDGYDMLADLYLSKHDNEKALFYINRAIKAEPDDKYAYHKRASIYGEMGKREQALKDLAVYIKLDPNKMNGYAVRAKYLQSYGREKEALEDFTKAREVSKGNEDLASLEMLKIRARLLSKFGRDKEAIEDLNEFIAKGIEDEDAIRQRGDVYLKLKEYDKAIADYTRSINLSPGYARAALEARAKAYKLTGKNNLAEKDLAAARKLKETPAEKPIFIMK